MRTKVNIQYSDLVFGFLSIVTETDHTPKQRSNSNQCLCYLLSLSSHRYVVAAVWPLTPSLVPTGSILLLLLISRHLRPSPCRFSFLFLSSISPLSLIYLYQKGMYDVGYGSRILYPRSSIVLVLVAINCLLVSVYL
jgi:hypothetical protein